MHWGLTRFERKRIERIVLDHPYFDMHAPLLTKKEIHALLAQGPRKTGPQVIAEVKMELGLNDAPATQQKRTLMDALRDASFVPSFRRTVVLGALCLLLVLFMTLTVPGRAFAEEVYSIIIDFVEGTLGMRNIIPSLSPDYLDFSLIPTKAESPQALATAIKYPVVASNNTMTSFQYEQAGSDLLTIRTKYASLDSKKCTMIQEVHGKDSYWSFNSDAKKGYQRIDSIFGFQLYAGTTSDGSVFVSGHKGLISLYITSRTMSLSEIIDFTNSLYICDWSKGEIALSPSLQNGL